MRSDWSGMDRQEWDVQQHWILLKMDITIVERYRL